ncbi:hypothetical protein PSKAS_04270 [Peribacillus sp. N1]
MCASVCPSNTLQWLTDEEIGNRKKQFNLDNGKWVTSLPYLESETNVKVNLPGILQGIEKLF